MAATPVWYGFGEKVALTFDDGPNLEWTPRLLDVLDELRVRATFFVVGTQARTYPDLIARMHQSGHEIGNHSLSHHRLDLDPEIASKDLKAANSILESIIHEPVLFFRPPGGRYSSALLDVVEGLGMTTVLWSVNPGDYPQTKAKSIVGLSLTEQVFPLVKNGSIILLHNGYSQTIQELPRLVGLLRQEGFEFGVLSEVLHGSD